MRARALWIFSSLLLALAATGQQETPPARRLAAIVGGPLGEVDHGDLFSGQSSTNFDQGTNGWQWVRDYVFRNGGMLAAVEPDGNGGENVYHFHPDHLGTPRQITNASGVQVGLHSYYPFGQEATDPAQTGFTKKFTGHERDTNGTGTAGDLDYMHARYCSPTLGRFLSFDPIGGNPRAPQSWNRYAYALNSPINYTDPEGLFAQLFFDLYFVVFDEITVTGRHALWR